MGKTYKLANDALVQLMIMLQQAMMTGTDLTEKLRQWELVEHDDGQLHAVRDEVVMLDMDRLAAFVGKQDLPS